MSTNDVLLLEGMFLSPDDLRRWAYACPDLLPGIYQPIKFGTHEIPKRSNSWPMKETSRYHELLTQRGGCFLHGKGWHINITLTTAPNVASTCAFWLKAYSSYHLESILQLLGSLADHNCYYGFSAAWAEYRARNGYTRVGISSRGEGWAGRDFRRYVPGLYWLNYFSNRYAQDMRIPVDDIVSNLGAAISVMPHGVVLRLYDHPERWTECAPIVAEYVRTHRAFFSISSVKMPDRPLDLREDFEWSTQVFKQWP